MKAATASLVLCIWLATGATGDERPHLVLDARGHTAVVTKVLFTPDAREVISVSADKTIRFWDLARGEPLRTLRTPIGEDDEGSLLAAAISPDGELLAVGGDFKDDEIYLISLPRREVTRVLKGHRNNISDLAFSPDGRRLLSGSCDNTARIWRVADGQCELVLRGHVGDVYGVAFSPDGQRCATASYDDTAAIWSTSLAANEKLPLDVEPLAELHGHRDTVDCVAWSPDGRQIATGSFDHSIRLWDVTQVEQVENPPFKTFDRLGKLQFTSVTFTADSKRLLFTSRPEADVERFDVGLLDLSSGRTVVRCGRHANTPLRGALSRDGSLAATCDAAGETLVWQTADGRVVHKLAGLARPPWSAAWSPRGNAIAWGNTNENGEPNAESPLERVFDLALLEQSNSPPTGFLRARTKRGITRLQSAGKTSVEVLVGNERQATLQFTTKYEREFNEVAGFTLLPGDRAAVGAAFGLSLFDTHTGEQLREFLGHAGGVWAVSTSPDGRFVLSAGIDKTLRIWDPDREWPLLSLFFAGDDWIAWTPEGYYGASPGGERLMGWHVNNGPEKLASFYPAAQFRAAFHRPEIIKRLLKTGSLDIALEEQGQRKVDIEQVLPPYVDITSPRGPLSELTSPHLNVRVTARNRGKHPVTTLRLLIDGRPYRGLNGVQSIGQPALGEVQGEWQIDLAAGKHTLKVLADSAASQGASDEIEVVYAGERVEPPKLYVVAVGISAYAGGLRRNDAAKGAQTLAEAFKKHSTSLFRQVEVQLVTDKQATRVNVLKALTGLRKQMTPNDYGIFFFAGHRQVDTDGASYFLPADVDVTDLVSSGILDDQFKRIAGGIPGRLITLLDVSHPTLETKTGPRTSLTDDLLRDLASDSYGVIAMSASTGRDVSLENGELGQTHFVAALVDALSGKADHNQDGVVYWHEFETYVADRVRQLSQGRQRSATAKPPSAHSFPIAKP